jgi:4-hydroxy-tetrahydrodipicolinate reductase
VSPQLHLKHMRIALIGYGAMGKLVGRLAEEKGHSITVVIHDNDAILEAGQLSHKLIGAEVAIDFTAAGAVRRNAEACVAAGVPLVEGTTGWSNQRADIERIVLERDGAFVFGANFSIGVNLFYRVVNFASALIAKFPEYEVFIEEQHHSRKQDAPSGTALKLKDLVRKHIDGDFSVSATRAGNIPGTHRLGFDGSGDQILLEHLARNRDGFAVGAIMAAEWIVEKTGFYEFSDIIDEIIEK